MSSEYSNNLPPSAKPYYFTYLQGFDWYKAQLLSLTGPIANGLPSQQQGQQNQNQNQTQSTQNADNAPPLTPPTGKANRIKIDGEITNVNPQNKTFSISTNQGTLALKLAAAATMPPEGLRVELDIPRAKEGQQIAFRPLPREQQSAPIKQQIISAEAKQTAAHPSQTGQSVPPLRANAPLIDSETIQTTPTGITNTAPVAPAAIPLQTLQTGAIVAVIPLPQSALAEMVALPSVTPPTQTQTTATQTLPQTTTASPATPPTPQTAQAQSVAASKDNPAPLISQPLPPVAAEKAPQAVQNQALSPTPNAPATTQAQIVPQTEQSVRPAPPPPPQNMRAIKIENIILPPAPQNAQATTPNAPPVITSAPLNPDQPAPQIAEFIGQTADHKPVIAVQHSAPPAAATENTTTAPVPRNLYVLNTTTSETPIAQGTKILFTPAPPQTSTTSSTQSASPPTTSTAPSTMTAAAAAPTIPPYAFPLTGASDTWPALDEITQSLQQTAPSAAQNLLQQSPNISSPAMKMEPAILFFLLAARSGDIAGWLGDKATEMLRASGKNDTISRILQDFTGLSHASREVGSPAVTPEWRTMPIPLFAYNEAHKIMLHYKYDDEAQGDESRDRKKSMRFLIDLDLNRMGDVQLDGFAQAERLDLIVRTQKPLSQTMQQIMRRKYSSSLEVTGFRGELSFHGSQEKLINLEAVTEKSGFNI